MPHLATKNVLERNEAGNNRLKSHPKVWIILQTFVPAESRPQPMYVYISSLINMLVPFGRQDVRENEIVADYVAAALQRAGAGDLECTEAFLKRLTHVQHICR